MVKKSLLKIEKDLIKGFEQILFKKMVSLKNPSCIYFTSWTFTQTEGKLLESWKAQEENYIKDAERLRLGRIWSFIFPEFREDYLVERTWNWMQKHNKYYHSMLICTGNPHTVKNSILTVCLKSDFMSLLNGCDLGEKIKSNYQRIYENYTNINEIDRCLKTARLLRYDQSFNKTQIEGINKAFSFWLNRKDIVTTNNLNSLFKMLYGKEDPALDSLEARKFLTIWQNFSVLFPQFPSIILRFSIPDLRKKHEFRYAVALCYTAINDELNPILTSLKEMIIETHNKFQREVISYLISRSLQDEHISDSNWLKTKQQHRRVIERIVGRNNRNDLKKLDRLAELAERLSFSIHEGCPCKFSFIAGTEQIWPSIEEIISLEEYREFNLEVFTKLCEANYSIFQVNDVVGFFNINLQSIYKIVRLRIPTNNELRKRADHIDDLDDLFCWTLDKIYEDTSGVEKSYIVSTCGDGKILFYGFPKLSNKSDLLFIWDVRRGELKIPLENLKTIKERLNQIGIISSDIRYKNIIKTIRKISATPGEGAALIIAHQNRDIENYLVTMDLLIPSWLRTLGLEDPPYLLKAAFILDGACLVTPERVRTRLAIYPHYKIGDKHRAFGLLENLKEKRPLSKKEENTILYLSGKGSKTHAACNLTSLPEMRNRCIVITVSADGPVRVWPD